MNELYLISKQLEEIEEKLSDIQIILENETNRKIWLIAKGYSSLNNESDKALRIKKEKELLATHITHLENEFQKTKEKLDKIQ